MMLPHRVLHEREDTGDVAYGLRVALRPRGLIARDGGVVFAYDARSMPSSAFDPDWNLVRVTARGFRNPMERLSVGFAPAGFSVHLK